MDSFKAIVYEIFIATEKKRYLIKEKSTEGIFTSFYDEIKKKLLSLKPTQWNF